jgi:diacylglycerol kinase
MWRCTADRWRRILFNFSPACTGWQKLSRFSIPVPISDFCFMCFFFLFFCVVVQVSKQGGCYICICIFLSMTSETPEALLERARALAVASTLPLTRRAKYCTAAATVPYSEHVQLCPSLFD